MRLPPPECKVYTPPNLAEAIVSSLRFGEDDVWLDPCVGPGAFVDALRRRGVPKSRITALDIEPVPGAKDHAARTLRGVDFFRWFSNTEVSFDKIIANPPFVPIERLAPALQKPILALRLIDPSSFRLNSNYWCAFLAASIRLLKRGGDLAFVLPAAWAYADYAKRVKEDVLAGFRSVEVHRCSRPLFLEVQEGCIVLIARGFGHVSRFSVFIEHRSPESLVRSLKSGARQPASASPARAENRPSGAHHATLGDVFDIGIGCVTGDNAYFLLTESQRVEHALPLSAVRPIVSKARHLRSAVLTSKAWSDLRNADERVWLFVPTKEARRSVAVQRYLALGEMLCDLDSYKLKIRADWAEVPLIDPPCGFISGMSKAGPWISLRSMRGLIASNTLYVLRKRDSMSQAEACGWSLSLLSSDAREQARRIGRRYADGLVKYEPKELRSILIPRPTTSKNAAELYGRAIGLLVAGNTQGATNIADQFVRRSRRSSR